MLDPAFTTARPMQPGLVDRLRADPQLLDRVLDHHNTKPIRVTVTDEDDDTSNGQHEIPSACFWIRSVVRGPDNGATLRAALSRAPSAVCGKTLRHGDVAFRCIQCAADATCIMCRTCFEQSPCVNHEYKQLSSGGGACDCGDPEAWKKENFCRRHQGVSEDTILTSVPPGVRGWLEVCLSHALRLLATVCTALRAAPAAVCENNDRSNGRLLSMAGGSLVKELVEVASVSDDGRRLVSLALASTVPGSVEMLLMPVGEETSSDFAAQKKNNNKAGRGATTRQRADVDEDDWDDDDDLAAEDADGAAAEFDEEEDAGGANPDGDDNEVTPEDLAAAEGDEELQGQLIMRLLEQMRRQQARAARQTQQRENREREAREHREQQQEQEDGQQPQQQPQHRQHVDPTETTPNSETTIMSPLHRSNSTSPTGVAAASTSGLVVAGASSAAVVNSQAVSTLEKMSFVELFLALELCPLATRPVFASQCWSTLKTLFDGCACDLAFRKAYTRGITRMALPWASAYCRSGGLFSVAVQCLTVATVVEQQLLPQQNISDNATLISSLLAASILNATQTAVTVDEANKRAANTPAGRKNQNDRSAAARGADQVYQLSKGFPRQAFAHISYEAYHPLMCTPVARAAALLSRPLWRGFLATTSLLHYNYFWRDEQAAAMPRTSFDVEFTHARRLYMYAKAAGEVTRGLMRPGGGTLEAALGMPHNKELADAIFDDCALHPVCTRLEHRNAAFHSLVQLCSVREPFPRLPVHSAAPEQCVAQMLQQLLSDAVFFIARQERAIARSDARSRSHGGTAWTATFTKQEFATEEQPHHAHTTVLHRLLQRPYDIINQKHLIGFHFPLYRLVAAITMTTLRGVAAANVANKSSSSSWSSSSTSSSEFVLRSAFSGAFSKVIADESSFSDALHNSMDRIIGCELLGAQHLESLWRRDVAGHTPLLNLYQGIDPTLFNEFDNFFLQCVAAGISTKVLARLVLARFSYTPQADRIDDKAAPSGYGHALRLLLTVATDPTRTCATYRGEVTARLLTRLGIQGAEVRSRLQQQATSTEMDDEDSKGGEDVFHEVLGGLTQSSRRRDATVFSLTDRAWDEVPIYTAGMPASFPALARQQYHDRIGSRKSSSSSSSSGSDGTAVIKPMARTGIDKHGPAFRESLPVLLQEREVTSTAVFLLLCRALSGTTDTTSAAAQAHPLSTVMKFGRAWKGRKALTVTPSAVCTAVDALFLAAETVYALFVAASSPQQQQQQQVIDWPKFEQWLSSQRSKQWNLSPAPADSYTTELPKTDFTPLSVEEGSDSNTGNSGDSENAFSFLLRRITGVNLTAFEYFSNAKWFKSEVSFRESSSGPPVFTGVDVLEALLSNAEEALSDVANNSGCIPQLRRVVATARDYESYVKDAQARKDRLAAIYSGTATGADGAGGSSLGAAAAAAASAVSSDGAATTGKPVKTAKERASNALAAMKKKKMAAASNFLKKSAADDAAAAASATSGDKKEDNVKKNDDDGDVGGNVTSSGVATNNNTMGGKSMSSTSTSDVLGFSRTNTATTEDGDGDTALLRSVLGGDALHRYAASFIDESVCAFCHRKGSSASPLCHLAQLSRNTTESRVCQALSSSRSNSNKMLSVDETGDATMQLNMCGHVAHRKCFTDRVAFTRNGMRATSVFRAVRGHQYLQDGECLCAICARIVSVAVPCISASSSSSLSSPESRERAMTFAAELLTVDTAQRTATGGAASQSAPASSPVEMLASVVCSTIAATALDLQLGRRQVMLREVAGMASLVAALRDAAASASTSSAADEPEIDRSSTTSTTRSGLDNVKLPPVSSLVLQVLRRSFDACNAAAANPALDDPMMLLPTILDDSVRIPDSVFSSGGGDGSPDDAAATSTSPRGAATAGAADQIENASLGVASFWARLLLMTVQLGTGRLSDSQLGSVAESVLRCASTLPPSSTGDKGSVTASLTEAAANTVSFPIWSPKMTDGPATTAAAFMEFPVVDTDSCLGVLDVAEEGANISAAVKFLFPASALLSAMERSASNLQLAATEQGMPQRASTTTAGSVCFWSVRDGDGGVGAAEPDAMLRAIVAAYPLPAFFRELLPVMKMAKEKKKNRKKKTMRNQNDGEEEEDDDDGDADDERNRGDRVNEPLPNSDEEPEDEEEARRFAERRAMERATGRCTSTNAAAAAVDDKDGSSSDDDDAGFGTAAAVSSLVQASSSYVCSRCGTVPRIPVLCVFCRQVFCARASPPELTEHSLRCAGGGTGVFVQLKVTQPLVLQVGRRGQVQPSMFLDRFGEEDVGLRRGRPLLLNSERYRKFLRLCVRCSFDHCTSELEDGGTFKTTSTL